MSTNDDSRGDADWTSDSDSVGDRSPQDVPTQAEENPDVDEDILWDLSVKHVDEIYDYDTETWTIQDSTFDHSGPPPKGDAYTRFPFTINYTIKTTKRDLPNGSVQEFSEVQNKKIQIRSPHLRQIFSRVIGKIQGISWVSKPLKVRLSPSPLTC